MTATLTATINDVPSAVGKLHFNGHANNGHATNGHATNGHAGKAGSSNGTANGKKHEAKLVDPFNYVVSGCLTWLTLTSSTASG